MFRNKIILLILLLIFTLGTVIGCSSTDTSSQEASSEPAVTEPTDSLLVYSGAGLRKPMDEIGQVFEEKYNIRIEYSYAGSAQNLSQIELTGQGDVWTPGDVYYGQAAQEKDLIVSMVNFAYHIPVIAVPKGNPANIQSLEDMAAPGLKIVLGDPEAAAIGKTAKKMLTENGIYEAVSANTVATTATVNELLVYMSMKQADCTIIWEDNVQGVEDVEMIQIPDELNQVKTLPVCVLKTSEKLELAQQFADFVAGPEGKAIFEKYGFKVIE